MRRDAMSDNDIILEKNGFVATLVINRPEVNNTLNPVVLLKIAEHFNNLSKTDEIRTVVIRGEGGKAFSAGFNISEIPKEIEGKFFEALKGKNPLDIGFKAIEEYPYPVIAMIDGYALGAGCELAMSCDIRVASENSKIGIPPSRLGLVYHPLGIQKFINVMGVANTKEAFYTGRYYDVKRAKEMGMVNYIVPKDELRSFTYALAEEISQNAPLSLKGHKYIFNKLLHYQGISDSDRPEIEKMMQDALNSDDLKEGSAAFFQKKKASFKGR
jgi:enoyl-CoA hydratase